MTSPRHAMCLAAQVSVRIRDIVALVLFVAISACQDSDVLDVVVAAGCALCSQKDSAEAPLT